MSVSNRVNPELKSGLEALPGFCLPDDLARARCFIANPRKQQDKVSIVDKTIVGKDQNEIMVRIYEPIDRDSTLLPVLLWIHGGGYIMGHPDYDDEICEEFVIAANCVVVAPAYRLAPENPYPAGLEDCYSTLLWIHREHSQLAIKSNKLAIAGGSAGGGLTAALAILSRDRGGPEIIFQMPLYPMLDFRNVTASSHEITDNRVWSRDNNIAAWEMYLASDDQESISCYASPSLTTQYEKLPPTYTCVGELDPFRDETITYVTSLVLAGVPVEFHLYPGAYHSFERAVPDANISIHARQEYIQALAKALKH